MSSGARCEEALPGTALGGIAMSILTSYYGNGGAKFSKKIGSNRPSYGFVALRRPTTPFGAPGANLTISKRDSCRRDR
jgi:hypothetical protein